MVLTRIPFEVHCFQVTPRSQREREWDREREWKFEREFDVKVKHLLWTQVQLSISKWIGTNRFNSLHYLLHIQLHFRHINGWETRKIPLSPSSSPSSSRTPSNNIYGMSNGKQPKVSNESHQRYNGNWCCDCAISCCRFIMAIFGYRCLWQKHIPYTIIW